jgi:Bacterial PH domain
MAGISHLLLDGETVEREVKHVNATLPGSGKRPGTLYLTNKRLIFRSRVLLREAVHDVPYSRIADMSSTSNGLGAAHVNVTTTSGDRLRFAVRYNAGPVLISAIRAHQTA